MSQRKLIMFDQPAKFRSQLLRVGLTSLFVLYALFASAGTVAPQATAAPSETTLAARTNTTTAPIDGPAPCASLTPAAIQHVIDVIAQSRTKAESDVAANGVSGAYASAARDNLAYGAAWLFIERTRLTRQIANVQNEAQTERASLKRREQELALQKQELEKEIAGERQRSEQLKSKIEQLRQRQQPTAPAFLSFLLTPAPVRGPNAPPPPTLPLGVGNASLLMELGSGDYLSYQIRLQTVEGREILRSQSSRVSLGKNRAFAELKVPAGKLAKGDYILILSGRTARGELEEVDQYFFRVQ